MPISTLRNSLSLGLCLVALAGCASMATQGLSNSVSQAILNQDDPAIVAAGAPAYLLLLDGLIEATPEDQDLLLAGARLYGAYGAVFVEDADRAGHLADKARGYARRALCQRQRGFCDPTAQGFDALRGVLRRTDRADVPALYTDAAAWAGWIRTRSGDWQAIADLPKVAAMMQRVVELDEPYDHGRAQLYLGVLNSQLPAALGGRPEAGRSHFERAIALSGGQDLMAKVEFARNYARLVFARELHDRLLQEVLRADPHVPGLTLSNVLAQQQARQLLDSAADYF